MKTTIALGDTVTFDPLDWNPIKVELPDGYYRVWSGALKPGDLYLNMVLIRDGITQWEPCDEIPMRPIPGSQLSYRQIPGCIVRHGTPVDKTCERCQAEPAVQGERFCDYCREIIKQKIRKTH